MVRVALASCAVIAMTAAAFASSSRLSPGLTGVPDAHDREGEQTCTSCHTGALRRPESPVALVIVGLPARYVSGSRYSLAIEIVDPAPERLRWGFELTSVDARTAEGSGRFIATDPQGTAVMHGPHERSYLAHTYPGTSIGKRGGRRWDFDWIAPPGTDPVAFYAIAVAADADGSPAGDLVYGLSPEPIAVLPGEAEPDEGGD